MFSVVLNKHSDIFADLLKLYFPEGAKIIDFTFGTGGLWWNVLEDEYLKNKYKGTFCDGAPNPKLKDKDNIVCKSINKDDYSGLGLHDVGVFDPPYLIGRNSFDYPLNTPKKGKVIPMQLQGKRSWGSDELGKYTGNSNVSVFNERVEFLKVKALQVIKPGGLLFVKVMDPRHKGKLVPHHITITNILGPEYELIDHCVYIRQGATTWKVKKHLQNLHGHWLIYRLPENKSLEGF